MTSVWSAGHYTGSNTGTQKRRGLTKRDLASRIRNGRIREAVYKYATDVRTTRVPSGREKKKAINIYTIRSS